MAILSMAQIIRRVGTLLDDPGQRRFSSNYIRDHVDQQNESMMITLERLGVQQQEQIAIFDLPVDTSDLSVYMQAGQPLASFMRPNLLKWKITGQPDTTYGLCFPVQELDEVDPTNLGNTQYRWAGGGLQVTPSGTPTTLKVYYTALTATLYDNSTQVVRGVGFILASMVAEYIASMKNGMGTLQKKLEKQVQRDKQNLTNLFTMQQQGQMIVPRAVRRRVTQQMSAGGSQLT